MIASHDLALVRRLRKRVLTLANGSLVHDGLLPEPQVGGGV